MRCRWLLLLGWLGLAVIHHPGWLGGKVFVMEDVASQFFHLKSRIFLLFHGREAGSWWDPLYLLGVPRLSQLQAGWFSPFSLWFAVMEPLTAWRLYPLMIDSLLLLAAYAAGRGLGCDRTAAGWAAFLWAASGSILKTSQYPCFKETLLVSALVVALTTRWWRRPRRWMLPALCLCGAMQVAAGSPSCFFYCHYTLALLLPIVAYQIGCKPRIFMLSLAAYGSGMLLAILPWLAFLDFFSHVARNQQSTDFAETFRLSVGEWGRRWVGESYAFSEISNPSRAGYPLPVDLSVAVTVLLALAWPIKRLRPLLLMSLVISLQSVGEAGGLLWLTHRLFPFTLKVRGADSFVMLAGLFLLWVGAQAWREHPGRIRNGLAAWAWLFALLVQTSKMGSAYLPAEMLQSPPWPEAGRGRLVLASAGHPPLPWWSMPPLAGLRTLVCFDSALDSGYAEGMAFSQMGPEGAKLLRRFLLRGGMMPVLRPDSPLLLSWGVAWVLESGSQGYAWRRLQPEPPRYWLSQPIHQDGKEWAARLSGDPYRQALVELDLPQEVSNQPVIVTEDLADRQVLRATGPGLLVGSDQWDPGWRCRVDGRDTSVLRANLALKAVWLTPGPHQIEWVYSPPWWRAFLVCQGLGWLLLAACLGTKI
ncbi:hypothetical protein ABS71_11405 [bacterium SCN 62-11]|nr:MAG: hypothetical protein ABS71_11405 [bacterium SCN 62-11]